MAGFKSRMINFLIRNRHWFRGKLQKERFDGNTSIAAFRDRCEKGANRFGRLPEGVIVKNDRIAGMTGEWLIPSGADPAKVILYVHGGGYVSGSCNDHRGVVSKLALKTGVTCLVYEYRLAPEHPFPAAVVDSVSAYRHLLAAGFNPARILLAGESAGGGLALALLLALKNERLPMPVAAVSISPWADLTCSGSSYRTKNKVSAAPLDSWFVFRKHYAGDHPLNDPLLSPVFGDLEGLPPLFINAGTDDELFDDATRFVMRAQHAGVDVTFRQGEGMLHCYPLMAGMFPEATEALDEIVAFIRSKL